MAVINYGELGSITQKYFYPKLVDNIFSSNPLLMRARKSGSRSSTVELSLSRPLPTR